MSPPSPASLTFTASNWIVASASTFVPSIGRRRRQCIDAPTPAQRRRGRHDADGQCYGNTTTTRLQCPDGDSVSSLSQRRQRRRDTNGQCHGVTTTTTTAGETRQRRLAKHSDHGVTCAGYPWVHPRWVCTHGTLGTSTHPMYPWVWVDRVWVRVSPPHPWVHPCYSLSLTDPFRRANQWTSGS